MAGAKWKAAIVVGASSGIGECVARKLADRGCRVGLVARREDELERVAGEIRAQSGSEHAVIQVHDVRDGESVPAAWDALESALGPVDLIVYCAGAMPPVELTEYTWSKDRAMVEVNVLGAMAWLNEAAIRMRGHNGDGGTIVGVSSVAGDRGRPGQPAYNASKAALSTYLEALYHRLWRHGIAVVDVRPGPVHTPMTAHLEGLNAISPQEAAAGLLNAAEERRRVAYVPGKWALIMCVIRNIPAFLFKRLGI